MHRMHSARSCALCNMSDLERFRRSNERDLSILKKELRKGLLENTRIADVLERGSRRAGIRILDIACGDCREGGILTDLAGEFAKDPDAEISLTGIDIRAREIADAKRRLQGGILEKEEPNGRRKYEFLVGDATKLPEHKELDSDFDLVFLRHQNYWNGARDWEQIFDHALAKLDDDAHLVITSYFDREHELALEAMQRLGGELVHDADNPEARALQTPGKAVDKHIAIFRKRK